MRRTQHAVSTVFPSVGMTKGLRRVAIRVSPSGKLLTFPSGTQERYPFPRPRVMEEKRKRATGRANTMAANPLNRIPIFMKNPRRERSGLADGAISGFVDILFLRFFLRVLRVVQSGIRLPWIRRTSRCQPGNYICDFLIGHWTSGDVAAPVGCAQFRAAGDHDRAQCLIADQRQKRIIRDGASLLRSPAFRTMAGCAICSKYELAAIGIPRGLCRV